MPAYPFDPRPLRWNPPGKRTHSFRGTGRLARHGAEYARNPTVHWESRRTISARLIVGFNIGTDPVWTVDDLIPIVDRYLEKTFGDPSSTFVSQKGIYQHRDGSGQVVHEDGAQVFIIAPSDISETDFEKAMVELAEIICKKLEQETVVVEIQINGISQHTMGVGA